MPFGLLLVPLVALAQSDPDVPSNERASAEVVVVDRQQLTHARHALIDRLEALGWKAHPKDDGRVVFSGPRAWMGKAIFTPTGDLGFRAARLWQPAPDRAHLMTPPNADVVPKNEIDAALLGKAADSRLSYRGLTVDPRQGRVVQRAIEGAVQPELLAYRRTLQGIALGDQLEALPDRLAACWEHGAPLEGRGHLASAEERRRALLDFWATRTDTAEGHAVMDVVAAYLKNVVMASPAPVRPEEASAAEARRDDGRALAVY